jgi:hypothetical protein
MKAIFASLFVLISLNAQAKPRFYCYPYPSVKANLPGLADYNPKMPQTAGTIRTSFAYISTIPKCKDNEGGPSFTCTVAAGCKIADSPTAPPPVLSQAEIIKQFYGDSATQTPPQLYTSMLLCEALGRDTSGRPVCPPASECQRDVLYRATPSADVVPYEPAPLAAPESKGASDATP